MNIIQKLIPALMAASLLSLTGCASQSEQENLIPPTRTFQNTEQEGGVLDVYDPIEPFNRVMYDFNARFDRHVFLPVLSGYKWVMPDPAEKGVSNFFDNLVEPVNVINNALQFKLKASGVSLGRFVINSTFGLFGFFEAADTIGLYEQEEDFGQTLGTWGVGAGPYIVLPLLGPSNLRDTVGVTVDFVINDNIDLLNTRNDANKDGLRLAVAALRAIDTRNNTNFRYFESGTPYEYELIRYASKEIRAAKVAK